MDCRTAWGVQRPDFPHGCSEKICYKLLQACFLILLESCCSCCCCCSFDWDCAVIEIKLNFAAEQTDHIVCIFSPFAVLHFPFFQLCFLLRVELHKVMPSFIYCQHFWQCSRLVNQLGFPYLNDLIELIDPFSMSREVSAMLSSLAYLETPGRNELQKDWSEHVVCVNMTCEITAFIVCLNTFVHSEDAFSKEFTHKPKLNVSFCLQNASAGTKTMQQKQILPPNKWN